LTVRRCSTAAIRLSSKTVSQDMSRHQHNHMFLLVNAVNPGAWPLPAPSSPICPRLCGWTRPRARNGHEMVTRRDCCQHLACHYRRLWQPVGRPTRRFSAGSKVDNSPPNHPRTPHPPGGEGYDAHPPPCASSIGSYYVSSPNLMFCLINRSASPRAAAGDSRKPHKYWPSGSPACDFGPSLMN
jgi:hypothetical protein